MRILIVFAVAQGFGIAVGVLQVGRDVDRPSFLQPLIGLEVGAGRVRLGRGRQVQRRFDDRVDALRQADVFEGLGRGRGHHQAQRIAQDIEASARERSRAELDKLKSDVEREYQAARVRLKEEIVTVALGAAERMVRQKPDRERQRTLVDEFLAELDNLKPEGRT